MMDFGGALAMLKSGHRVFRAGWNGTGMWVAFSPGFGLGADRIYSKTIADYVRASDSRLGIFRPYLMMRTVDDEFVPWVASQTDLLAEDWLVAS